MPPFGVAFSFIQLLNDLFNSEMIKIPNDPAVKVSKLKRLQIDRMYKNAFRSPNSVHFYLFFLYNYFTI